MDLESESKLISLISQIFYMYSDVYMLSPRIIPRLTQIISLVSSMDLDSQPKPLSELMLLTFETISVFNSMDLVDQPEPLKKLISHIFSRIQFLSLVDETLSLEPEPELMTLIRRIRFFVISMNSNPQPELEPEPESELEPELELEPEPEPELEPEPKPEPEPEMESELEPEQEPEPELETVLISLISQLISVHDSTDVDCDVDFISLSIQIISLVKSTDFDSQPKPESELMSLIAQTISLVNSMDLDSQPKPLSKLISLISQKFSLVNPTHLDWDLDAELVIISLVCGTVTLEPEPELISRIRQIFFVGIFMDAKWKKLISICPEVQVRLEEGKFHVTEEEVSWISNNRWKCLPLNWEISRLTGGKDATHFFCKGCNGKSHDKYDKAPVEIKQSLHLEHSLRLVLLERYSRTRECYCCNEDLKGAIYYCEACNFAINFSCAQKPAVLSINHLKWHEHPLALFPRQASLTCNLCALADSSSPIYMCPNCDIVVHLRCINLPRVIRISRHLHRISFTPSFDLGDWCCGVCRKKIEKYGGYSCVKDDCSYAAHSRCATQSNVWDGIELEGEPEEIEEEELESFVRISDGIIQHFSHQHHHLRLDENTSRDYDECKLCQGCITPIYSGNFYSCMQCDFILHEECAKLSRKIHHPIHPHMLTLVGGNGDVINYLEDKCSACPWMCKTGFFYKCGEEKCPNFQLHVQCATVSEPLVHESHVHPLFLTSKPGERRRCSVCEGLKFVYNITNETFNCIECDFVLCFECATLPQKVSYKHDKHMLTLSYGEDTSTMTYWCEVCEHKINPQERFYMCDEYCCVTLHIECLLGQDLYMKPGSSWRYTDDIEVYVLPNNHMSRPICYICKKRCPHKIVFQSSGLILCSTFCYYEMKYNETRYDFDHK